MYIGLIKVVRFLERSVGPSGPTLAVVRPRGSESRGPERAHTGIGLDDRFSIS